MERRRRWTTDNPFAADAIADGAAQDRAQRHGKEKNKEVQLRRPDSQGEFIHQIKGEVTVQAGGVEKFGKHQNQQQKHR